jgi:hypothetical protein
MIADGDRPSKFGELFSDLSLKLAKGATHGGDTLFRLRSSHLTSASNLDALPLAASC